MRATVAPPTTVNRVLLMAELDPIADAGAGDPGICNGPTAVLSSCNKILDNGIGLRIALHMLVL
jgi:hypothetical protein